MAFKSMNHDDEKIFYNRLWKLMEERNLSTARELAQALYAEEIVPVDSASEDEISIIGSMTRRIQEHLNLEGTDKLQGRYVKAYCDFFGCSADYLFGLSSIKSENPDVIRFCEATGLSEKSVRRLIEDLPEDIKRDLVGFWSNVLESNLFYEVPLEFHQMCYELGQYRIAQDQVKAINLAAKKMDNSDTFVDTWRAMMESNYLKEAQPHEGSYHMHLNELLVNVTACLENWVDEYVPTHKKELQQYFDDDLNKRLQKSYDEFLKSNRQISRRIKKHLWLSNSSWARDVHSFGILHSWGALAGKSCSAQASSIWLIAGAFRRTQSK